MKKKIYSRFFYQKKKFQLPQYVPKHVYGYVLKGFDEIDQWHAESNASVKIDLRRWQTSGSLYFVFTQYRIVSPYHCNTGIEVRLLNRGVGSSSEAYIFPCRAFEIYRFSLLYFRPKKVMTFFLGMEHKFSLTISIFSPKIHNFSKFSPIYINFF